MSRYQSWLLAYCLAAGCLPLVAQEAVTGDLVPVAAPAAEEQPVRVAVLGYEQFAAAEGMPGITSTTFATQMSYLKEQGITPISLQQFIAWLKGKIQLPGNSVLITLDEANTETYAVAMPVLRDFGFPYVVFADGRSFKDVSGCLSVRHLQEMRRAGAEIGSHSMNRPQSCDWVYADESGPEAAAKLAERELGVSAQRITATFGNCEAFSYPRGYANANMVENLAVYGYRVAFGRKPGKVTPQSSAYLLNRYMVREMKDFACAVNFGAPEEDAAVLQQVRAVAAHHQPVSQPVEVKSPENATARFPAFAENPAVGDAVQPPLPPVVDVMNDDYDNHIAGTSAPIPAPVVDEAPVADLVAPELKPRPVSDMPAAGTLIQRTVGGDWVTREFPRPVVPREQTRVAVLCYHDFSNTRQVSEMCLRTAEFCQQMQYIKDAGLTVITMQDFREWLLGDRRLPERCVLITIDDGWRSVYSEAFPVLKAYGYPFTLYLYTDFIGVNELAMTREMVREMMACGATVGSHSASHLYPSKWKSLQPESPELADTLKREIPDSVATLQQMFGNCSTYCYPGGYHTPLMQECMRANGIDMAFTVVERKVTSLEDPLQVHRYVVFGTDPRIFRRAVNFDDVAGVKTTAQGITEARERARAFFPKAFENVGAIVLPAAPAEAAENKVESAAETGQEHLPAATPKPVEPAPVLDDIPAPEYTDIQA